MNKSVNRMKSALVDLKQQRADLIDEATKLYSDGGAQTAYRTKMDEAAQKGAAIERLIADIAEIEKEFDGSDFTPAGADERMEKSGSALLEKIRKSEKYTDAWLKHLANGINPNKAAGNPLYAPLVEGEKASKALSISGGSTPGEDGGFLVPLDFDMMVIEMAKEYIDLSELVTVVPVNTNVGWRNADATGLRTKLPKITELGKITPNQQPEFKRIDFNCEKYGDILPVSNELFADAQGLMDYLANWWTPKYIQTKNALILGLLDALVMNPIAGSTDAAKVKALKKLINTGFNTALNRRLSIVTNQTGFDEMDNWVGTDGRALLTPDLTNPDFTRFKGKPVRVGDDDLLPTVSSSVSGSAKSYNPVYVGDFKSFAYLFLRQGVRVKSTDVGGDAFETDSIKIRATCRMDIQEVNPNAVKLAGFEA